jgi:hypothetical protein
MDRQTVDTQQRRQHTQRGVLLLSLARASRGARWLSFASKESLALNLFRTGLRKVPIHNILQGSMDFPRSQTCDNAYILSTSIGTLSNQ